MFVLAVPLEVGSKLERSPRPPGIPREDDRAGDDLVRFGGPQVEIEDFAIRRIIEKRPQLV